MDKNPKHFYEFGPFRLDPSERVLSCAGSPVPLTPKAFDTLLVLVRCSGRTVEKEELFKEVWPDTFVEDGNLAVNIFALRKALGQGNGGGEYIETIPKRGYRFRAKVHVNVVEPTDEVVFPDGAPKEASDTANEKQITSRWLWVPLTCVVILAIGIVGAVLYRPRIKP